MISLNLPVGPVCNFQELVTNWSHLEDIVDLNCCQEDSSTISVTSDLVSIPDVIGFTLGRNISFQRTRVELDLNSEFEVIDITGQFHRFEVITVVYHEGGLYGHYTASKKNLMKGEWFYYNGGNIRGSVWSHVQERRADIVGSIVRRPGRSYRASARSHHTTNGAARGRCCSPRPASRSHRTELRPIGHSRRISLRVQRRARWPPSEAARRSWPSALCASG